MGRATTFIPITEGPVADRATGTRLTREGEYKLSYVDQPQLSWLDAKDDTTHKITTEYIIFGIAPSIFNEPFCDM